MHLHCELYRRKQIHFLCTCYQKVYMYFMELMPLLYHPLDHLNHINHAWCFLCIVLIINLQLTRFIACFQCELLISATIFSSPLPHEGL